jgi:hypothetical protein
MRERGREREKERARQGEKPSSSTIRSSLDGNKENIKKPLEQLKKYEGVLEDGI